MDTFSGGIKIPRVRTICALVAALFTLSVTKKLNSPYPIMPFPSRDTQSAVEVMTDSSNSGQESLYPITTPPLEDPNTSVDAWVEQLVQQYYDGVRVAGHSGEAATQLNTAMNEANSGSLWKVVNSHLVSAQSAEGFVDSSYDIEGILRQIYSVRIRTEGSKHASKFLDHAMENAQAGKLWVVVEGSIDMARSYVEEAGTKLDEKRISEIQRVHYGAIRQFALQNAAYWWNRAMGDAQEGKLWTLVESDIRMARSYENEAGIPLDKKRSGGLKVVYAAGIQEFGPRHAAGWWNNAMERARSGVLLCVIESDIGMARSYEVEAGILSDESRDQMIRTAYAQGMKEFGPQHAAYWWDSAMKKAQEGRLWCLIESAIDMARSYENEARIPLNRQKFQMIANLASVKYGPEYAAKLVESVGESGGLNLLN